MSYTNGPLDGMVVSSGYDPLPRRAGVTHLNHTAALAQYTSAYGPASRLPTLSGGANPPEMGSSYCNISLDNMPMSSWLTLFPAALFPPSTTKALLPASPRSPE